MASDDEDKRRLAAAAINEFLAVLGYRLEGELVGTGRRVADAWLDELVSGEGSDPAAMLRAGSLDLGDGPHGVVVLHDIALATMCPHHLMPSHGYATVGYLPNRLAAGLGTIAEAAHGCARRLALQETLGENIAAALLSGLEAQGSFCRLRLVHTCFVARGERQAASVVDTFALRGVFAGSMRDVALALSAGPQLPPAGAT